MHDGTACFLAPDVHWAAGPTKSIAPGCRLQQAVAGAAALIAE